MEPARQRLAARCILLAFAAGCVLWLATRDYSRKISTNVLDLIPPAEQSPELALVRNIAGDLQSRVMLFGLRDLASPGTPPAEAAEQLAQALSRSPAFAEAMVPDTRADVARLGKELFDERFALLLPTWLGERWREFSRTGRPPKAFSKWLAERSAADLEASLARPEAAFLQDLVPSDPLLLLPGIIQQAQAIGMPGSASGGAALVWARIADSPLSEMGQLPVFEAIDAALAQVRASHPRVEVQWTGVNRFAYASRARIEREIRLLNLFSVLAVLSVGCLIVRRVWKMLHLAPVILCSLLGAWTISTAVFDRLHVLVFVIGSLLSGVAVDYGFYIYLQPPAPQEEPYAAKLRRLMKPLLASCLTTTIGFSLLLFSDLPFIRQVGLFVASGLLCALAAAALYFAQLERSFLEGRRLGLEAVRPARRATRTLLRGAFAAAVAAALGGPWLLRWKDDVRELEIPAPELYANDAAVRGLFGDTPGRTLYLTYGGTLSEARAHLAAFLDAEGRARPQAAALSLGSVFPTEEDWRSEPARLAPLGGFEEDFRSALENRGFLPGAFQTFFESWDEAGARRARGSCAGLYSGVERTLKGPLADLFNARGSPCWFLTIVRGAGESAPPPEPHTISLDRLQTLDRLFARYRWSALRLSLVGLGLVIASVFAIYPFRPGLRIALIPAGSCFFIFGILGLLGQTLNLFHLLGAFLGFCLCHNYSIFSSESARLGRSPPTPVRLSALCAAASFGVLACSRIPVVHALGLTVALIVLTALLAIELEPVARGPSLHPSQNR